MVWVYYSAQIFLLGAEFTWVYAHSHGSRQGAKRPGRAPLAAPAQPALPEPAMAPVRLAPAPLPPLPQPQELSLRQRKPIAVFGAAAALGAIAGLVFRLGPPQFHRPKPGLLSRLKLR